MPVDKWAQYAQPAAPAAPAAIQPTAVQKQPGDKWAAYAQPASTTPAAPPAPDLTANPNGEGTYSMTGPHGDVKVPYSSVMPAQRSGYKLNEQQRFTKDYTHAPIPDQSGSSQGFGDVLRGAGNEIVGAAKGVGHLFAPPETAAESAVAGPLGGGVGALAIYRMGSGIVQNEKAAAHQTAQYAHDTAATPWSSPMVKGLNAARTGVSAVSMVNPLNPAGTAGLNDAIDQGKGGEALGAGLVDSALIAAPEALGKIGGAAKGMLRGSIDTPMAGTELTPRMRYDAAQRLGVQFDAADATNSNALKMVKKFNRDSLVGSPVYDAAADRNVAAVRDGANKVLADMSPLEPEQGGGRLIQERLKADQSGLRDSADEKFRALDDATGGAPVPGAAVVGQTAQSILKDETPFYTKYPTFKPGMAVSALQDLSKVGDTSSYAELQRLRSNTHELTNANPDLVKDQGTSWLQRMTGTLDDAITDKGLTPEQTEIFRDANREWADMKGNYDDPSSPLYHAVRSPNPSKLAFGVGGKTPEMLENLRPRIGEEGMGALQRGVATDVLKNNALGDYDFRGFGRRLYGLPDAYRQGLFGPEIGGRLDDIARTTHAIGTDFNPSGSAKQLQKFSEGTALASTVLGHPFGLAPLLQYPIARAMNSPGFVKWLMKEPSSALSPFSAPTAAAVAPGRTDWTPPGSRSPEAGFVGDDAFDSPAAPPEVSSPFAKLSMLTKQPGAATGGIREMLQKNPALEAMQEGAGGLRKMGQPVGPARNVMATPPTAALDAPAQRSSILPGHDGASTTLHTEAGSLPAKYRLVEADDLTTSHNAKNFKPNSKYPEGVQERDYENNKELQLGVITRAQKYEPARTLTDNPDGTNGPPVVTPDGTVLGGNSRVMTLQRLYDADPSAYTSMLKSKAAQFGLQPEAVDGMRKPVLVRQVDTEGDVDGMRFLGQQLNKGSASALSSSEAAVSNGKNVSPETLHEVRRLLNEVGPDATLRDVLQDPARSNAMLVRMEQDGIINANQRGAFTDPKAGGMNPAGKDLLERALMGSVMDDPKMMDAAPAHITQKLKASIGPLAELASRGDEWNILPALRRAISEHGKMAASGISVEDHLNQASVFDKPLTPLEEHLVRVLGENQNVVRDAFATYGKDAQYATPGQASFLGPSPHEAFNHAFGSHLTQGQFSQR